MLDPLSHRAHESVHKKDAVKSPSTNTDPISKKASEAFLGEKENLDPSSQGFKDKDVEVLRELTSPQENLQEKAKSDVDKVLQKSQVLTNKVYPQEVIDKVKEFTELWKDPVLIMNDKQSQTYCESNNRFNDVKVTCVSSIDPNDLQTLHITYFDSLKDSYHTLLIAITPDQKLKWGDKEYSDLPELIKAISDKIVQPLCSTKGKPLPSLVSDVNFRSNFKSPISAFTEAIFIAASNEQYETALLLFKRSLMDVSIEHLSIYLPFCFKKVEDYPELTKKMAESLGDFGDESFKSIARNESSIDAQIVPLLFAYDSEQFKNMSEPAKYKVVSIVFKGGDTKDLEKICVKLDVKYDLKKILNQALGVRNLDLIPILKVIKDNQAVSLITLDILDKIFDRLLREPKHFESIISQFPEFHGRLNEKTYLTTLDVFKYNENNLRVLLKYKPLVTAKIISQLPPGKSIPSVVDEYITLINSEDLGTEAFKHFITDNSANQARGILRKFPNIKLDKQDFMKTLDLACKLNSFAGICILLEKAPHDIDKNEVSKILTSMDDLKKPDMIKESEWKILYSFLTVDDKAKEILEVLIKYYCLPARDVIMTKDILSKSPEMIDDFLIACSTNNFEVPDPEWKTLIKEYWDVCTKKEVVILNAIKNKNNTLLKWLEPLHISDKSIGQIVINNNFELIPLLISLNVKSETILNQSITHNNVRFISRYLTANPQAKDIAAKLVEKAIENNCLTCALALGSNDDLSKIAKQIATLSPKDIEKKLKLFFLNSHSQDVLNLIDQMIRLENRDDKKIESIEQVKRFILGAGRLIARFPDKINQEEMKKSYGESTISYLDQQENFGEKRYKIYKKILEGVKKEDWSAMDIFNELLEIRSNPHPQYNIWKEFDSMVFGSTTTPISGRYSHFLPLVNKVTQDKNMVKGNEKYTIKYVTTDGRVLPLTSVVLYDTILKWRQIMQVTPVLVEFVNIFNEIKAYTITNGVDQIPSDLKKMIAKAY